MIEINQLRSTLVKPRSLNLIFGHPMARRYHTFLALVLASVASGCYLPTGNRLCEDLHVASAKCKDHASIRNTFISAFPVGMKAQDLRDSVNRIFIQRDSLTHLHEGEGIT